MIKLRDDTEREDLELDELEDGLVLVFGDMVGGLQLWYTHLERAAARICTIFTYHSESGYEYWKRPGSWIQGMRMFK